MDSPYRFELTRLDPLELAQTAALLQVVFPRARHLTADYLQWMYVDNPEGRAVGCNAWLGDDLVGHMVATPMRARTDRGEQRGIGIQNGAIHPDHRGRRLQSGISDAIFADGIRQGYAFSFATGNRASTGPLLTRYKLIRTVDVHVGLGAPRRRSGRFVPSFERLWTADILSWRLANPQRRYAVRGGRILAATGIPGIAAVLGEGFDLSDSGVAPPGPLRVYLGLDPGAAWAASGFIPIPQRLRPSPLNLVWRDLAGEAPMPDVTRMIYRPLDSDLY